MRNALWIPIFLVFGIALALALTGLTHILSTYLDRHNFARLVEIQCREPDLMSALNIALGRSEILYHSNRPGRLLRPFLGYGYPQLQQNIVRWRITRRLIRARVRAGGYVDERAMMEDLDTQFRQRLERQASLPTRPAEVLLVNMDV